jgi:5-methylthioadenosine/S-adenosylhomocysteine deaminase
MFQEMQVLYYTQRSLAQLARFNRETKPPAAIGTRDILEFATIRGAECCALDAKCGSLTPGKEADIVLVRTQDFPFGAFSFRQAGAYLTRRFLSGGDLCQR